MKPYFVRSWQCSPFSVSDTAHENTTMPGVIRSDTDLTQHVPMSGKMLAPNLLRLNSVGEVSAESFPEKAARKSKLGFSKSLDSISPTKNLSSGTHRNNARSGSFLDEATMLSVSGRHNFSSPSSFTAHHNHRSNMMPVVWQQPTSQLGTSHWRNNLSRPAYFYDSYNWAFSPMHSSTMNYPYPHRIPGLLPGVMYSAMSAFPNNGVKKMPQAQGFEFEKGFNSQTFVPPQKRSNSLSPHCTAKANNSSSQASSAFPKMADSNAVNSTLAEIDSYENIGSNKNCVASSKDDKKPEGNVKLGQSDSVNVVSSHNKSVDQGEAFNKELTKNGEKNESQTEKYLKRRNDIDETETPISAGESLKCSLTSVINDLSNVLFLRKSPRKGRPSCKKRKKRQHQRTSFTSQPQVTNYENVDSVTNPNQSQCSSPTKTPLSMSRSSTSPVKTSINSFHSSSPSSQHLPPVTRLFCSPDSDSEWSDNEDIDDCDSLKWSCDFPKSLSPISNLGSALSFDALFKPNSLPCLDNLLISDTSCDSEQDPKCESTSSPSGSKKSLCFSFSVSVSEDEDSDKSFESLSASPSEQLILDFEFGNGLSLETIIGKKTDHFTCTSNSKSRCSDNDLSQSEHDLRAQLIKVNTEWNKNYPSVLCTTSSADKGKVQFASEKDLVQIHIVGNEERRGTWCEDGQRFLKRIQDVGKAISYVFTEKHRKNVCQKLGLS